MPDPTAPLSPQVFMILVSLADEDRHGYAIIQDVADRTEGEIAKAARAGIGAVRKTRTRRPV